MTRRDFFRRRIMPVAFGVAIALLARESCQKQQRTHATMILDFGSAAPRVLEVDADLVVDGNSLAHFHKVALPGGRIGDCRFETALTSDDGELHLDIDVGDRHVFLERRFHTTEGATVTISLAEAL